MGNIVSKILSPLNKLKGFLSIFAHNFRGMIGLLIILMFTFMALGAPLLTPYHPIRDQWLSGAYSAPALLKQLPKALGGMPNSAENFAVTDNKDFSDGLTGWNYTLSTWKSNTTHPIAVSYDSDVGLNFSRKDAVAIPGGDGSAKITYLRENGTSGYGSLSVAFYRKFTFPYAGTPRKWVVNINMLPTGTVSRSINYTVPIDFYNGTWADYNLTINYLTVPVKVYMYMQRLADGKMFTIWPYSNYSARGMDFTKGSSDPGNQIPGIGTLKWDTKSLDQYWPPPNTPWVITDLMLCDSEIVRFPTTGLRNGTTGDVVTQMFPEGLLPSDYLFGVNMTFVDPSSSVKSKVPIETTVYLDNMWLTFQGRIWGILGTDQYGSDLWSQLVNGSLISLYVGLLSAILSVGLGLIVGLSSGYMGKYVDEVLMRFSDMLLVVPTLPLLIVLIAVIGPGLENLILVIGLLGWMGFARLVRSQVLTLKERPFVEAARAVGAGKIHIMGKHILPNVMSLVYVSLATSVPGAIVAEAALSFLGFYDPSRMSWGRMLYEAQGSGGVRYWWWVIPPGLCIALLAIAFIMLGFALDEVFNPRLRMRR